MARKFEDLKFRRSIAHSWHRREMRGEEILAVRAMSVQRCVFYRRSGTTRSRNGFGAAFTRRWFDSIGLQGCTATKLSVLVDDVWHGTSATCLVFHKRNFPRPSGVNWKVTDDRWKNALFLGLESNGLGEMRIKLKRDAVKRCCNFWSNDVYRNTSRRRNVTNDDKKNGNKMSRAKNDSRRKILMWNSIEK